MAEQTQSPTGSSSQILMMIMIFATMFIMFDPGMRNSIGNMAGIVLEPVIGFNGNYPVMTVLLAGFCLVTFSSVVRDYFIDWIDSAEKQDRMKDFNKVLREARMSGDEAKVKRLTEKQMDMSKDQMASTMDQMKPMMFTMIFLIATFAFIGAFIEGIPGATFSVPWANNVDMVAQAWSGNQCCAFTNWMLLYMLVSMSVSQVISRVLKLYKFSKYLEDPESYKKKGKPAKEDDDEEDGWDGADEIEAEEDSEYLEISDADHEQESTAEDEEPDDVPDDDEEETIQPLKVEE